MRFCVKRAGLTSTIVPLLSPCTVPMGPSRLLLQRLSQRPSSRDWPSPLVNNTGGASMDQRVEHRPCNWRARGIRVTFGAFNLSWPHGQRGRG